MKNSISLFPKLSEDLKKDLFEIQNPRFYYLKEKREYELTTDIENHSTTLTDEQGIWTPDEDDLYVKWEFSCDAPSSLYESNYAIACPDANIGVALQWFSAASHQRGSVSFDVMAHEDGTQHFLCCHKIPKAVLRGTVGLTLILYIKDAGHPSEDESYFANIPGYLVGELSTFEVHIDGNGSFFPIYEVCLPGQSLWNIEYDKDDPEFDLLSDCVSINLNKAHVNFCMLDRSNQQFNTQLFTEVISEAILILIESIRQDDADFVCLQGSPQEGSVAEALLYFKNVLGWNFTDSIVLSRSIHEFVEKSMKES